jgi:hypothetical protein
MRRHDLDWIRVLVFALLIFYHVGMFFVPWNFHIKNNITYDFLAKPMYFLNRWRLPILFVISGMGTYFSLQNRTSLEFSKERIKRLLMPLIFGILIIVPPQVYIERIAKAQFTGAFFNFWPQHAFTGIYPEGNFSWHHLWFLPYLLLFALVSIPIFLYLKKHPNNHFIKLLKRSVSNPLGLLIFCIPLVLIELFLEPYFPKTHALIGDWYVIAKYWMLFLYGYLLMHIKDTFFTTVIKFRFHLLGMAVLFFTILYVSVWEMPDNEFSWKLEQFSIPLNYWFWILSIFGFGATYLNKAHKILTYANKAVYPFYILHQTITIIIGYFIMNLPWSFLLKFTVMVVGTFLGSWVLYEFAIRPWRLIRPLFGLKKIS